MNNDENIAPVWSRHAAQWGRVGPPLRPSEPDARAMSHLAAGAPATGCLVLGVTPEIVHLPWLTGRPLLAVDHSEPMVRALWDANTAAVRDGLHRVLVAEWQQMPVEDAGFGLALGDGSLNAVPSLADAAEVLAELHRVLAPGAVAVLRCFVRGADAAAIGDDLPGLVARGAVGSFDVLKWRIAMALAQPASGSVAVAEVWRRFEALFPDRDALASATGWARERIDAIDAYRHSSTRYQFPLLAQLHDIAAPLFTIDAVHEPAYELGDGCPTVRLRRR